MYDHSEDQQQKDTILLNYCIDDIEGMCKVDSILSQGFAQFCQALGWAWSEVGWCGDGAGMVLVTPSACMQDCHI